ncbi:heparinase II/III family protein [Candidatus Babeliales bacterium]|nr:heparinase II/III family protein [Candidatus Babeliales bacterium]
MRTKNFIYYPKRLWQLGITGIARQATSRIRKKWFAFRFKAFTGHKWPRIARKHRLPVSFTDFSQKQYDKDFIEKIRKLPDFIQHLPPEYQNKEFILVQANNACKNCFDLLGSGKVCFKDNKIPWQSDFKQKTKPSHDYATDIKVPWELSRFQHLYFLGFSIQFASNQDSSQTTRDERQNSIQYSKYTLTFQTHVSDWLKKNPFLVGVNWINPMEVSLRAINWLWAFSFFKDCPQISTDFWEKFVCSLYDHMIYLENNWEVSDKPNNHYISDLVGHFYLYSFFNLKKRKQKTLKRILKQFEHQVLPDGTSYEGSTSYHKLDTELFLHVSLLCQAQNIKLPNSFHKKLKRMFNFLRDCSVGGELVQIGDNDSGKVVVGVVSRLPTVDPSRRFSNENPSGRAASKYSAQRLLSSFVEKLGRMVFFLAARPGGFNNPAHPECAQGACIEGLKGCPTGTALQHYPDFGLSIIKNDRWHITFHHATYKKRQPTGHFHNDQLAITLAIDGIPVLVDPGSYLYTASEKWRNRMRSFQSHNTFYTQSEIENEFQVEADLFQLDRQESKREPKIKNHGDTIEITSSYKDRTRKISYDQQAERLTINDSIHAQPFVSSTWRSPWAKTSVSRDTNNISSSEKQTWNLLFHPELELEQVDINRWFIRHCDKKLKPKKLLLLSSDLEFSKQAGFFSPAYGKVETCTKLVAHKKKFSDCCLSFSICVK